MKVDEALERLRAADPAASAPDALWPGPPQRRARAPRHVGRGWLAVAAAAAVVAGVAATVAATRDDHADRAGSSPDLGRTTGISSPLMSPVLRYPDLIEPGAPDPHLPAAQERVRRAFARVPLPAGAVRRSTAPLPELRQATIGIGNIDHGVTVVGWWTSSASYQAVREYVTGHAPPLESGTSPAADYNGVYYETVDGVTVDVTAVSYGSGAAIRVDAISLWTPSRTTDSVIGTPISVDAKVRVRNLSSGQVRSAHRRLTGVAALRVSATVDGADGAVQVVGLCPAAIRVRTIDLVVHAYRGVFRVAIPGGCLERATITTPSGRSYLIDPSAIETATLAGMGLPEDWGM